MQLRQRFSLRRFLLGDGPHAGPLVLRQRRVYILPTRLGFAFAALLLVMLIGAINYSNNMGFLLTFLLAAMGVVTMLHTYRNLLGLVVSVSHISPTFAGEPVQVPLLIDNPLPRSRPGLKIAFKGRASVTAEAKPGDVCRVTLMLPSARRGRHPLDRFTVSATYPLGLFRAWSPVHLRGDYLVYPRPVPDAGPLPESADNIGYDGAHHHGTDDFVGLRTYHPGDSLRHVHWKAAARGQGLLTKQFGGGSQTARWVDWRRLEGLDTETRLAHMTRWVLTAQSAGYDYGLWLPGQRLPPAHGQAHDHRCLEALALYGTPP